MTAGTIDAHRNAPVRLAALAELTRLGTARRDGFDKDLLNEAEALLRRSGERLRMSGSHTVVALAGGTGSGKSSLFNALSGANFSPPGVTRPTTRHCHACVWGMEGAAPLLDWLSVQRRHRYARASALDEGEGSLAGLLLLDLPDHDSVVSGSAAMVDRLVKLTDMLVWVLDPLKYADASVHQRYLVPLAGHAAVTTVVLNQADTLTPEQVTDCEADLRRLLDAEGLTETPVLVTSATAGTGLDELRAVLAEAVAARRAASDRIAADIDALLDRFAAYAGDPVTAVQQRETVTVAPGSPGSLAPGSLAPESVMPGSVMPGSAEPAAEPAGPPWEQLPDPEDDPGPAADHGPLGDPELAGENGLAGEHGPSGNGAHADADRPARPPWEEEGADDWSPWGTPAANTTPSSRPPWEDATPNGAATAKPEDPVMYVPVTPAAILAAAFEKAAGVAAVTETLHGVRERNALRYVGWPPARLAARVRGRSAARKKAEPAESPQAQRSDIDNAITVFADEVGSSLPEPWSRTVRAAARSRADKVQEALGSAMARALPPRDKVTGWWRLIALAQWLVMLLAVAGIAWIGAVLAFGQFHALHKPPSLVSDVSLIPWLAVMVVALLLLGSLTASWCQNMVVLAADREREQAVQAIRARIAAVTRELVLVPVGTELADYEHFRAELATARTGTDPRP